MEIKQVDLAGRLGRLKINDKKIETPLILPVINPSKQLISLDEMRKMGIDAIITNSYFLWKKEEYRAQVLDKGIHDFLGFDGLVMTDSGAFQLMQYKKISVTNREIVEFQDRIGVDIGVILDIPGLGDRETMKKNIDVTVERAREVEDILKNSKTTWAAPIQGGIFEDLRKHSAQQMVDLGFDYFAVGSVVPLLNRYRFHDAFNALVWSREVIPWDKPVHFFGAGHPMMFAFGVALGADVFDSAAYALFADKGKYLTVDGTKDINEMKELPCSCPVCSTHTVDDLKKSKRLLALHNLYVTIEEIKRIKEAIREGTLWELLEKRARAHPKLYNAFLRFADYANYLEGKDRISKRRFFVLSTEVTNRPEVVRHKRRVKSTVKTRCFRRVPPFGDVPIEVMDMYPFGQIETPDETLDHIDVDKTKCKPTNWEIVNGIIGYLYGYYDLLPKDARIEVSKNTGRIRNVYVDEKLWLVLRARDYMPILHGVAWEMSKRDGWKVIVKDSAKDMIKEGKSTFCKFVVYADERIRTGMEILIVSEDGELLATGTARMSGKDMTACKDGVAVDTRKLNQEYKPTG